MNRKGLEKAIKSDMIIIRKEMKFWGFNGSF